MPPSRQDGSRNPLAQEGLWQGLSLFFDQLLQSATAVWHLQRVLAKKRDPLTHVLFLDTLKADQQGLPLTQFWYDNLLRFSHFFRLPCSQIDLTVCIWTLPLLIPPFALCMPDFEQLDFAG